MAHVHETVAAPETGAVLQLIVFEIFAFAPWARK